MGEEIHGVNYLDDLLNEMTKEAVEDEEEAPPKREVASSTQAQRHKELSRPESFRGDFDYLEALLNDIAPQGDSYEQANNAQTSQDITSHHTTQRRPPSMVARATTASFDLESTLKDLEDTFYNGLEGGNLKRTTSVITWSKENQQEVPNKKEDYMDVLDSLVNMDVDNTYTSIENKEAVVPATRKSPPPSRESVKTSVLDQMIDSYAEEKKEKKPKVQVLPSSSARVMSSRNEPKDILTNGDDHSNTIDQDISYLDQMLSSFITSGDDLISKEEQRSTFKPRGVQVLPSLPSRRPLRPVEIEQSNEEVPSAVKDEATAYILPRSRSSLSVRPVQKEKPRVTIVEHKPRPYIAEPSRVSRAPVPASASVAAPVKVPALRATTTFSPLPRATINMDDLLDQVIHSIQSDDGSSKPTKQLHLPRPNVSFNEHEDDDVMSQVLSDQELNMPRLERKAQVGLVREWAVPFSEFEPLLQSKLGIGNHGEAYRPGIWRGHKVVVKRWNTSLTLTFPLQEEITVLTRISHPNIVPVLGACGDGRGLYTISEYIPGANLHGFLHNGGLSGEKDSTVTIIRIALQIAQAMAHLHAHGITHRSLAPKNVLLDSHLAVHIRDYGFASVKDDVWTTQRASNPRFPLYDSQYIAPELMRGAQYNMQVDVYSFGVLLWESFAGESAHDGLVLRDLHGCPFPVQKLIKLCVAASPPARPPFATVVKILSQPMETLLKYNRPADSSSGFFNPPQSSNPRASVVAAPLPRAQSAYDAQPPVVDEEEEDRKLQKVLYALSDLIRTPSDHAQLRAVNAVENLVQSTWNIGRMIIHQFVPYIVDLLRSKFVEVQETTARVIAVMLKNPEFCVSFIKSNGIGALFDLLSGQDDGVRLVAMKALTVAAYTTPEFTRNEAQLRGGGPALATLLRADNEFVRVQTAWALGQLLVPDHPLTDSFFAADGVQPLCSLLITGGSPASELRALGALLPLLTSPHTRAAIPSSIPRKICLLLSSPQPPLRAQALQAVTLLASDKNSIPILLDGHGLSVALLALIQPPLSNPLLLQALDLLRSIAESPVHAQLLVRAGLREALHPHLATEDSNILKSANMLYNLLV